MRLKTNFTDKNIQGPLQWAYVLLLACSILQPCLSFAQAQMADVVGSKKERVCRVDFAGMRVVEVNRLYAVVRTVAGGEYDSFQVAEDMRSLWKIGLFSNISRSESWQAECGRVVVFVVEEQPLVDQVFVEGNKSFKLEDLPESIKKLKPGMPYSEKEVSSISSEIREFYNEKGFPFTRVSVTKQSSKEGRVKVVFGIEEGARPTVMEVHFRGNQLISSAELAKLLLLRPRSARSIAKYVLSCLLAPLRMSEQDGLLSKECASIFNLFDSDDPAKPGRYGDKLLEYASKQIESYYKDMGFLGVRVALPELTLSVDQRILTVTFVISEGPRSRKGRKSIVIKALPGEPPPMTPAEEKRLLDQITRPEKNGNSYLSLSEIQNNIAELSRWAASRGYPSPRVDVQNNTKELSGKKLDPALPVDLLYEIVLGPQVYVRRIRVSLNGGSTASNVIWRNLTIWETQRFDQTQIDESKKRLLQLGFFSNVDIRTEPVPGTQEWVDLVVDVSERPTGTLQAGGGYSSQEGIMFNAQVRQDNFLGWGGFATLNAQVSSIRQLINLSYFDPRLFDSHWQGGASFYNTLLVQPYFARAVLGGRLTTGYELVRSLSLRASYRLERVNVTQTSSLAGSFYGTSSIDLSNRSDLHLYQSGLLSALRLELLYQRVDNLAALNTGTQSGAAGMDHNLFVEGADQILGSQIRYIRTEAAARFYIPLWKKHIQLRLLAGAGVVWSREAQGVPIFERYFLGGVNDIRGFNFLSLGPRIPVPQGYGPSSAQNIDWFPIGGNLMLKGTAELEFSIFPELGLRGVVFADAGNAYNLEKQYCNGGGISSPGLPEVFDPCATPSFANLRYSVGVGLRWLSPIGLLRFEWAFPINRLVQINGGPGEVTPLFLFGIGPYNYGGSS